MNRIEVELRGTLTRNNYSRLQEYLEKHSSSKETDDKLTYFFVTKNSILKVTNQESKNSAKITIKSGDETKNILKEIEIPIPLSSVDDAVFLFKSLGFNKVNPVPQKRTNYKYKDTEIALKYTPDWEYHFEIESIAQTQIEALKVKKRLSNLCKELRIKPMTPKQIRLKIEQINKIHGFI